MVSASVPLTRAKLRALQTRQRKASLLNQKQRLCRDWAQQKVRGELTSCLPPDCVTRNKCWAAKTVTLPPGDRITAAAEQIADAAKSQDTTQSATEKRSKVVFAEQAGLLELPHARSCSTTEACKIPV